MELFLIKKIKYNLRDFWLLFIIDDCDQGRGIVSYQNPQGLATEFKSEK